MNKMNRRDWNKLALAGLAGLMLPGCTTSGSSAKGKGGVIIGVQSYSFRDRTLDEAIVAMQQVGLKSVELWQGHLEPKGVNREGMKEWRQNQSVAACAAAKEKFAKAGITIQAFNYSFRENFSEEELESGFKMAQALGTNTITCSSTVKVMPRVDVYARKYKTYVGMHNHDHFEDPNEFASPDSFARGMQGASEYIKINLDIGHFTAANFDAVAYIKENHQRIVCLHIKDRKRNHGANLPFGEGETPIREVLTLLKTEKYPFPANIEYEYKGADTVAEVKKCVDYCRNILAG